MRSPFRQTAAVAAAAVLTVGLSACESEGSGESPADDTLDTVKSWEKPCEAFGDFAGFAEFTGFQGLSDGTAAIDDELLDYGSSCSAETVVSEYPGVSPSPDAEIRVSVWADADPEDLKARYDNMKGQSEDYVAQQDDAKVVEVPLGNDSHQVGLVGTESSWDEPASNTTFLNVLFDDWMLNVEVRLGRDSLASKAAASENAGVLEEQEWYDGGSAEDYSSYSFTYDEFADWLAATWAPAFTERIEGLLAE
ncbi:hypothetical protein [Salininema proteolyticum]|uniref:Lipoprotein n=1 Tax=Salininema proteolyticum TaxID=1607685 RepID=A0ABV8U1R0_9ACTN